jgi:hypothetical protein
MSPRKTQSEAARAATAAAADATPVYEDEQRLPLSAFDDAYEDRDASSGRHLQQHDAAAREERETGAAETEEGWPATTLFGPARPASQPTAAQHLQAALDAAAELALGAQPGLEAQQEEPEVIVTIMVLGARQQQPRWQRAFSRSDSTRLAPHASLLDQLALASHQAALRDAALGRRAPVHGSAGSLLGVTGEAHSLGQPLPRWKAAGMGAASAAELTTPSAAISPTTLATVDLLFVASVLTALVCVALLAVDVWRYGWRQPPPPAAVLGPLPVVLAAEEVLAGPKACSGLHAKLLA